MTERAPLSKKKRFDVFKRDGFVCQYCGRTPPGVVLEVDHVIPVSAGGSGEDHNLITSCFDCNRGKSDGTLEASPIDVKARAALLAERMEQAKAYDAMLQESRDRSDEQIEQVLAIFQAALEGWTLKDSVRPSIRRFLESLPLLVVCDAMEMACFRVKRDAVFKYFCGVCWNKIREQSGK